MKKAFGAIDLLIGLLLTAGVFMIMMKSLNGISSVNYGENTKSVREYVDETVKNVEDMRQQSIDYQKINEDY